MIKRQLKIDPSRFGKLIGQGSTVLLFVFVLNTLAAVGGSTLAQITKESSCAIDIPRKDAESQLVSVEGTKAHLDLALAAISKLLNDPTLSFVGDAPKAAAAAASSTSASSAASTTKANNEATFVFGAREANKPFWQSYLVPKGFVSSTKLFLKQ